MTAILLLSCQPRVTLASCFAYKVIRDLESIDHLCIYPIRRIGLIYKGSVNSRWLKSSEHVFLIMFYLAIVNKVHALRHCHSWLAGQSFCHASTFVVLCLGFNRMFCLCVKLYVQGPELQCLLKVKEDLS